MADSLSPADEIKRKSIHLSTTAIPVFYYFYPKREHILLVCILLVLGFFIADVLRLIFGHARTYFLLIFSNLLRQDEAQGRLTGATWLFIGILVTILVFPVEIAVPSMLLLTVADPVAAIIGKHWGSFGVHNKTLEGSSAFFIVAMLVLMLFFGMSWQVLLVAIAATITELMPLRINDNISVPVVSGMLMYILF